MREKLSTALKSLQRESRVTYEPEPVKRYNILTEVYFKRDYYYLTDDGYVLRAKMNLPLPYHPVVDYKRFNDIRFFDVVEEPSSELEKLLHESVKNDTV